MLAVKSIVVIYLVAINCYFDVNIIPAFIYRRISHRPNLVKIIDNIGWLFIDKILRMGVGLVVGVWLARYLGPEQFGKLNFAIAFTSLFGAIVALGLPGIVVRDIVNNPESTEHILGTAAFMHIISGVIAYLLLICVIFYLRPDDYLLIAIVAILGSMLLLKGSDISVYWFESQVLSRYTVWVQNSVFLIFAVIKTVLIFLAVPLIAFAWAMLAEAFVASIILLLVMSKSGPRLRSLRANIKSAKVMFAHSWPLMLSGISIWIYMKIDQIMLGQMLGDNAVGIYSAATRISEVWYFIPATIVASVFPAILTAKKSDNEKYLGRLQKLYDLMSLLSVIVALPMTFLARPLIIFIYGPDYATSGTVLSIHIWGSVFVFLGIASSNWFIAEGKQMLSFQRAGLGGVINITLNMFLIPSYGVVGAAIATVLSQAVASLFYDLSQFDSRKMFWMKLKSLNPIRWLGLLSGKIF